MKNPRKDPVIKSGPEQVLKPDLQPTEMKPIPELLMAEDELLEDGSPELIYWFARVYLKGRWIKAEPLIATNPYWALLYMRDILKCRFREAEPAILNNYEWFWDIDNGITAKDKYFSLLKEFGQELDTWEFENEWD